VLQKTSNTRNEYIRQSKKICNLSSRQFVRNELMVGSMEKMTKTKAEHFAADLKTDF